MGYKGVKSAVIDLANPLAGQAKLVAYLLSAVALEVNCKEDL